MFLSEIIESCDKLKGDYEAKKRGLILNEFRKIHVSATKLMESINGEIDDYAVREEFLKYFMLKNPSENTSQLSMSKFLRDVMVLSNGMGLNCAVNLYFLVSNINLLSPGYSRELMRIFIKTALCVSIIKSTKNNWQENVDSAINDEIKCINLFIKKEICKSANIADLSGKNRELNEYVAELENMIIKRTTLGTYYITRGTRVIKYATLLKFCNDLSNADAIRTLFTPINTAKRKQAKKDLAEKLNVFQEAHVAWSNNNASDYFVCKNMQRHYFPANNTFYRKGDNWQSQKSGSSSLDENLPPQDFRSKSSSSENFESSSSNENPSLKEFTNLQSLDEGEQQQKFNWQSKKFKNFSSQKLGSSSDGNLSSENFKNTVSKKDESLSSQKNLQLKKFTSLSSQNFGRASSQENLQSKKFGRSSSQNHKNITSSNSKSHEESSDESD
jgi:hypothetical protein